MQRLNVSPVVQIVRTVLILVVKLQTTTVKRTYLVSYPSCGTRDKRIIGIPVAEQSNMHFRDDIFDGTQPFPLWD
jgi:hypothetical protein